MNKTIILFLSYPEATHIISSSLWSGVVEIGVFILIIIREVSKPYDYGYDYGYWTTPCDVIATRIRTRKFSEKLLRKTCPISTVLGRIIGV